MKRFREEVTDFLKSKGLDTTQTGGCNGWEELMAETGSKSSRRPIILIEANAPSIEEADKEQAEAWKEVSRIKNETGIYPLIISQDRWHSQSRMTKERILAHLEIFTQIYARNCEVKRLDKKTAADFLDENHSYGDAACRYRYGLYLKRHTGHNSNSDMGVKPGTLVAVATFSNARKWKKGDKVIKSYEWTRYASLPGLRVAGGMGKLLQTFIKEVNPDDIMSYADLEWSEGGVYEQLGFTCESVKGPVIFTISSQWQRTPIKAEMTGSCQNRYLKNFGSSKYRLKLTDYM